MELRKVAWGIFSEYVRQKEDCCFTCGKGGDWRLAHAGHFRHGYTKPTYFNEINVHRQCVGCNHFRSGNLGIYGVKLVKIYGQKKIDKLIKESNEFKIWHKKELEEIIKKYKVRLQAKKRKPMELETPAIHRTYIKKGLMTKEESKRLVDEANLKNVLRQES